MYPNIPATIKEKADAGEIFHLWDHLTFRYDNIYQTQYRWYENTNDIEFKLLLKKGLQDTLKTQAKKLEKELSHFGVPLPTQPPGVVVSAGTVAIENRISLAREKQLTRFRGLGLTCNAEMGIKELRKYCPIKGEARDLLRQAFQSLALSARAHDRIIKIARTIADLAGSEGIESYHLAEAIQYRNFDRQGTRLNELGDSCVTHRSKL